MKPVLIAAVVALCVFGTVLSACGRGGITDEERQAIYANTRTLERELRQLQNAYDDGLMTTAEYEAAKASIYEHYDR